MDRNVGAATRLSQSDREELAILALARSAPISDLAVQHGVSRKFVYAQKHRPASHWGHQTVRQAKLARSNG
jgi:hypothetical protein